MYFLLGLDYMQKRPTREDSYQQAMSCKLRHTDTNLPHTIGALENFTLPQIRNCLSLLLFCVSKSLQIQQKKIYIFCHCSNP